MRKTVLGISREKTCENRRERADPGGTAMPGRPVPKAAEIRPSKGEQKAAVYRARTRVAGGPESELSRLRDRGQAEISLHDKPREIRPSKGEQKAAVYRARTRVAGGPESELSRLRDRGPGTMRKTVLGISREKTCENRRERADPGGTAMPGRPVPKAAEIRGSESRVFAGWPGIGVPISAGSAGSEIRQPGAVRPTQAPFRAPTQIDRPRHLSDRLRSLRHCPRRERSARLPAVRLARCWDEQPGSGPIPEVLSDRRQLGFGPGLVL